MNAKYITAVLGLAVFAIPVAVPASQPANVKVVDLNPVAEATAVSDFERLLADPRTHGELSIVLPTRFTTLEWINQDPFRG